MKLTNRVRKTIKLMFTYLGLIAMSLFSLIPIFWMISSSIKLPTEMHTVPPRWIPNVVTFKNYLNVLSDTKMLKYFWNSTVTSMGTVAVAIFIGVFAGYGFARFDFKGKNFFYVSILVGRMLPAAVVIVPFYMMVSKMGLLNTYPALILIYLVTILPLSVWLLTGFFKQIPKEIEEMASIDGCSQIGILFRMILPLSLPAIFAVGMYSFIVSWNIFIQALVLTTGEAVRPVSVGLVLYMGDYYVNWGDLMAASVLMTIPTVVVFLACQKFLVQGLTAGAVKG